MKATTTNKRKWTTWMRRKSTPAYTSAYKWVYRRGSGRPRLHWRVVSVGAKGVFQMFGGGDVKPSGGARDADAQPLNVKGERKMTFSL